MQADKNNIYQKASGPAQEAYRVLRTNIQFCSCDNPLKSIAITSCNPGEGKTTTSINLAIAMANSGSKVLLVDADLRKPALMKHLGNASSKGLSNYISGGIDTQDVIYPTSIPNLYFTPSGIRPPNPAELIGSARFVTFLETVREEYDIVIFDTPPLGSVIDCAIISSKVDGTILIVKHKAVPYKKAMIVKEQLEKANARLLGVVLNRVDKSYFRNYYSYYDYGSSTDTGTKSEKRKIPAFMNLFSRKSRAEA